MSIEEKVKSQTLEMGADFVGIAPRSRFEYAPEWSHPKNLLPDFHSVIVFGIAMNRGTLEAWFSKSNRRAQVLADKWALQEVERISFHLSRWLEKQGFKSLFIAQNGHYNVYRGRPDFSHKHAAVAAGLGNLGCSSLLVHPQFGAAVHLCSVITEAELTPDPMMDNESDPCIDCNACLDICPTRAISRERTKSFIMEGREYSHRWIDKLGCAWGCGGFFGYQYNMGDRTVGTWAYNNIPIPSQRSDELYRFSQEFVQTNRSTRHHMELVEIVIDQGTEYCGNCQKVCVGTLKDRLALKQLHIDSGVVKIPDDPTLLLNLRAANANLEKYPIPEEKPGYKEGVKAPF